MRAFLFTMLLVSCKAQDKEAAAIGEVGAAAGRSGYGPDLAVEFTPVERWLEVEIGVAPLSRRHHSAEWNTDLLLKKPWSLARKLELMAGFGPEWVRFNRQNSLASEAVVDFMLWPWESRRFGFFLEPAYDYSFAAGHDRGFGVSFGLLFSIR